MRRAKGYNLDADQDEQTSCCRVWRRLRATRDICFRDGRSCVVIGIPYRCDAKGLLKMGLKRANGSASSKWICEQIQILQFEVAKGRDPALVRRMRPELGRPGEQDAIAGDQGNAPSGMPHLRQPTRKQDNRDRQRRITIEACEGLSQFSSHGTCGTNPPHSRRCEQRLSSTLDMI